jgi:metal-responsive CopG/Arc/MetJ family transcriptional regulator
MEIIVLKGQAFLLRELADKIISTKGIEHGTLTMTK